MAKTYDCVVVGAGCFGVWTALRLRESGKSVALIDALGPGNSQSSSGGASRILRMGYGQDEIYSRWAWESLAEWKVLFQRIGQSRLFQHTGVLWTTRAGHPHAEGTRVVFDRLGVRYEALAYEELRTRYPQIHFEDGARGVLELDGGVLLANQAVRAVADFAVTLGVDLFTGRVLPPLEATPLESIVTEDGRTLSANTFVFACGPWLPKLFPRLLGNVIRVTRQEVFYFKVPAEDRRFESSAMPVWIDFSDDRGGYAFPRLAGKEFKLALDRHGPEFDPDTGSREVTPDGIAAARAFLCERFPSLSDAPLADWEVCQYENTDNGDFLIDRHPGLENVWLVGGGSGHGFKHGPAVGSHVACSLETGALDTGTAPRFSLLQRTRAHHRTVY